MSRKNLVNALIAIFVMSLIVLGCTCNQEDGFKFKDDKKDSGEQTDKRDGQDDAPPEEDSDTSFKADKGTVPTREQNRALVKETLNNFNDAIKKKDFADFRETVSRKWRNSSKVADFNKGFKQFIDKRIDISKINNRVPEFDPQPRISKKYRTDVLFLEGKYDTSPLPVRFKLEYVVEDEEWKLVYISVDTRR